MLAVPGGEQRDKKISLLFARKRGKVLACRRSRFILVDNEIGITNMVINNRITAFYK